MILLQLNHISKSFDGEDIFTDVDFEVKTGERIGIVGRNGAGKSTLMKIITGVENYDSGNVSKIKNLKLGYLTQQMTLNSNATVFEEMSKPFEHIKRMESLIKEETDWLSKHANDYDSDTYKTHMSRYESLSNQFEQLEGYQYESKIKTVLHGLNFSEEDFNKPINDFSGGQKTRLSLAQMLLNEPDLLLLDEPTNHLDLETTKWLEDYLRYFKGAIVIISHDRYFLDKIVTQIYDVALGDVKRYVGNYEEFIQQRDLYYQKRMQEYESQQAEIKRLETFVEKNITRASTSGMAKSRRKILEKMERIDKPMLDAKSANIQFGFDRNTGNDVMHVKNLEIGYQTAITKPISIEVSKGDHIAIIGPNGIGKSTLIKTIANQQKALNGDITFGANLQIGYYDQKQAEFKSSKTILDYVWDQYPLMNEKDIRAVLGRFLFVQDDVKKIINDLSGGEKARLQLALLMLQRDNVLILDEPTNHLDLDMRQALTEALIEFEGALVVVSHDRHLIRSTTDDLYLVHDGKVEPFDGDLEDYQQWLTDVQKQENQPDDSSKDNANSAQARKDQKRREAELRTQTQPLRKEIARLEKEMEKLNALLATVEEKLGDSGLYDQSRKAELTDCLQTQAKTKSSLEACEMAWLDAQEQLEAMLQAD